ARSAGVSLDFINIYSIGGVIWVLSLFYTPYVYLFVIAPMRQMDAALEDAARVHGASFWMTLRHVTIPLLMPALLSGALVVIVTGKGYRPTLIVLRPSARAAALVLEAVYIGGGVVLPVIALLMVSFSPIWTGRLRPEALTLANYKYVLFNYALTRQAIANSLTLGLVGATLGVVMSLLQAYYLNR